MNLNEAKKILELQDSWNNEDIKKNYKRLAMKYHPDKCKDPESQNLFVRINEANQFMERVQNDPPPIPFIQIIDLAKIFGNSFQPFLFSQQPVKNINIEITIKEYFTGVTKNIKDVCPKCSGCGFETPDNDIQFCLLCKGDGSIKFGDINILKCMDLNKNLNLQNLNITVVLNDKKYSYSKNKIYYRFNVSLKESLIGFQKKFKDPFDEIHTLVIKNVPIKPGDGYLISSLDVNIVLLFNIIYPKNNFSQKSIDLIKNLNF